MFVALSVHLLFVFLPHYLPDEPFYATIPYRLLCGDSLIQEEWHLSQLSSFFTYLPVRLWITVKGSADGLFLFLRLVYLLIHTAAAVVIYRLFRTYQYWAIVTALIYYLQTPYKIYAMSYNSMFAFFFAAVFCLSLSYLQIRFQEAVFYIRRLFCCLLHRKSCFRDNAPAIPNSQQTAAYKSHSHRTDPAGKEKRAIVRKTGMCKKRQIYLL